MSKEKTTCPSCDGFGKIFGAFHPVVVECDTCNGKGWISDVKIIWIKQGKILKDYRLNSLGIGLREACRKYSIDPSNLSKMERGIIKPQPIQNLYKNE